MDQNGAGSPRSFSQPIDPQPGSYLRLKLPPELLLCVANFLPDGDLSALARTSQSFYDLLNRHLYRRRVQDQHAPNLLVWAVSEGIIKTAELALQAGADINARQNDITGNTALHQSLFPRYASQYQPGMYLTVQLPYSPRMLNFIIQHGANVNVRNRLGTTPLQLAAYRGHLEFVRILIESGGDLAALDSKGGASIHEAARGGNHDVVHLLLAKGADIEIQRTSDGATPLHMAVIHGRAEATRLLLNKGANPNSRAARQRAPLHSLASVFSGPASHLEMIRCLIARGANLEAVDDRGSTPLHFAICRDSFRVTQLLLMYGANIEAPFSTGYTPLQLAIMVRGFEGHVIDLLIYSGANLSVRDGQGRTLLDLARRYNDFRNCGFLLDRILVASGRPFYSSLVMAWNHLPPGT